MEVRFFKCNHCGNVALKVVDGGAPLVCCGEEMVELVAGAVDAAQEKHVPVVTVDGDCAHVNVGSVDHPMEDDHYIQFICAVTDSSYAIHSLHPGNEPKADFRIAKGESLKAVYELCNIHGLWKVEL